jgi:glycosyltransferase involved in cell wall biosynthesis
VARWSDGIIVSSRLDRDWVCRRYGLPLSQVAVIHQAPAPVFLAAPAVPMTAERLRRVLYVGQFAFVKAPHVVADAFSHLAAQRPGLALTWCCADGDHEKARSLLSPEAREAVRFVGWMPQQSLSPLYDNHGVLLLPSFYEGFGKVFLEAMARGMCVVASDVGGARDIITQGTDGLQVPPGDAQALVEAVCTVQENLSLAQSMSARARETARLHTWERVAREALSFYASLSAANAAGRVA